MTLLKTILENKDNLKEDKWFYPETLLSEFEIYDYLEMDNDTRLQKKWFESWICTDTEVGIAVYFLDGEIVCISWQPYRKSDEEFWFVSEELGNKLHDYFLSLIKEERNKFRLLDNLPDLEKEASKIEYGNFIFSAKKTEK
jgi:hypothetical protein